jgi:hypothetical protein
MSKEELIECARKIQEYCKDHPCTTECPFYYCEWCRGWQPIKWDLPEKNTYKETL